MENSLTDILEQYPRSELNKYGDFYELLFRAGEEPGCLKVTGTIDQVKQTVHILVNKYNL